jgi:ATP-dependent RNA helicase HelY
VTDAPVTDEAWGFALDRFQRKAMDALDAGHSVLVAAPTGSGKTVVAEHAVAKALEEDRKVFYTTPIKALSNQKYHDLVARHGSARVGLLTGDNAINGEAPVVVMTTEVLRNMIYARSGALVGLRYVVLDEVHYLQDTYRGPAWEEVITHLDAAVRLVCLSATVSNAEEVAEWLSTVRGHTELVLETRRPVELSSTYLVEDRTADRLHLLPVLVDGRANPEGQRFDRGDVRVGKGRPRRRFATPRRIEVVDLLAERDLLPAIHFVFSRKGCDEAADACLAGGVRLTTAEQRTRIRAVVESHVGGLDDDDLAVLGYGHFLATLEAGVAAHHAGMVPPFKEAVEACFVEGLLGVVFATETLALGINMPARTVVIDKLTKFTGERHEFLTPGQYTQLTGRAGRRGIDANGTAVVLWSPYVAFGEVAGLVSSRSFPLTSAFRPTYNMAANLVRRYRPDQAHHLLNLSFAQYQTDRAVVRLEARLARKEAQLAELVGAATCERGDVADYVARLDRARARAGDDDRGRRAEVAAALRRLKPGEVIELGGTTAGGRAAVLSVSHRKGGSVRARVVTATRKVLQLGEVDFREPPEVVGTVPLPEPFSPRSPAFQRAVAERLHGLPGASRRGRSRRVQDDGEPGGRRRSGGGAVDHPVAGCPDRDRHVKAQRRRQRAEGEVATLKKQVTSHGASLARRFDRILALLDERGFTDGWALTLAGRRLVRIFHECDLLIAEALTAGLFDDLDAPSVAALASVFTYEHRSSAPAPPPALPGGELAGRWRRLERLHRELNEAEEARRLPATRAPDAGFAEVAHGWASGGDLDDVLEDGELTGGDFVRNVKQLVDLLRQIAEAAGTPATAEACREAADRLFRGVVAASSVVEDPDDDVPEADHEPDSDPEPGADPGPGDPGSAPR